MNTASGKPEHLPFDLRQRRVVPYHLTSDQEKAETRVTLARVLEQHLRSVLLTPRSSAPAAPTPAALAVEAVNAARPDQAARAREYMFHLCQSLDAIAPDYSQRTAADDLLLASVDAAIPLVTEFITICNSIAAMQARDSASALYRGFRGLLERYSPPVGFSGAYVDTSFDFYKFVGHELFVALIAACVRESRWELIADLLAEDIYAETLNRNAPFPFHRISEYVALLDQERRQRLNLNYISVRAQVLKDRYTEGPLAPHLPFREFTDADLLLFLRTALSEPEVDRWSLWVPWSAVYA
jgi:hypothetical protein